MDASYGESRLNGLKMIPGSHHQESAYQRMATPLFLSSGDLIADRHYVPGLHDVRFVPEATIVKQGAAAR
jgi:hypothetical protein